MASASKKEKKFSTDRMVRNLVLSLIGDFRSSLVDPTFCSTFRQAVSSADVSRIRHAVPTPDFEDHDPYRFKVMYQLQSVFKRYRFEKDLYTLQELEEQAIALFLNTQARISDISFNSLPASTQRVIEHAKIYIRHVLGEYDDEEHRSLCRFGKRASVGIPARKACEAERWELPVTGSQHQIDWFDSEMSQIDSVQDYWIRQLYSDPNRSVYQPVDALKLALVPKTFKSLRAIMPNTTIGSYMSHGLGVMIRKRLKRVGYDIGSLQMRHRFLAQLASTNNLYVTADLSSASDSISVELVKLLLPPDWFEILNLSRIKNVILPNGHVVESQTFCTMGIGFTFPLQTLVFLSLLKAIEATEFGYYDKRTISVYGDDLIYSKRQHPRVVSVFQQLGFVINLDKTFDEGGFRESCGGDYYRGVDVRPFQPQNGSASVGAKTYEAILYKYINGLLMRWTEYEVRETLLYLVSEVEKCAGAVKRVPIDYPDDSGIKCEKLNSWNFLKDSSVAHAKYVGHGLYRFPYLSICAGVREEKRHEPYYWRALRPRDFDADSISYQNHLGLLPVPLQLERILADLVSGYTSPFILKEDAHRSVRCHSGRRLRRILTMLPTLGASVYQRKIGVSCFGTRS